MRHVFKLSLPVNGNEPPTEFRLFTAGVNATEKGDFIFDASAAQLVMDAFAEHGVDLAIDLEHQMLDPAAPVEPTARDARGWFRLELREDGSLWAVDVKWTNDGATRLAEKRQRYVSPAFTVDPESGRITKIINVAITALPATHGTPALVAAAAREGKKRMDPNLLKEALDVIEAADESKALDLLKRMVAGAVSGEAPSEDEPTPKAPKKDAPADTTPAPAAASARDGDDEALTATRMMTLTKTTSVPDALIEMASIIDAERKRLCARLVTEGGQAPASVWASAAQCIPKPFLQRMSLTELREHVESELALGGRKRGAPLPPRAGTGALTPAELSIAKAEGCDPEVFAKLKASRDGAVTR